MPVFIDAPGTAILLWVARSPRQNFKPYMSPHSPFNTSLSVYREYANFRVSSDGEVQGVGLLIAADPTSGKLVVLAPIQGGPADRAGIQPGDEVGTSLPTLEAFKLDLAKWKLAACRLTISDCSLI